MSSLSDLTMLLFIFSPILFTFALVTLISWLKLRKYRDKTDGAENFLRAAIRCMPDERNEWGEAMMAELTYLRGRSLRWEFAHDCVWAALFPPAKTAWPLYLYDAMKRLGSMCGVLSVVLPPLGLPMLWLAAVCADTFTTQDGFTFAEGFMPGIIGCSIVLSIVCLCSGVPLGIVGLVRREQIRWLSMLGPCLSITIFSYVMIAMHFAAAGVNGD